MIQNDSRLGFLAASFVLQAILERESWMREVCVWGCLCDPPDRWSLNLFSVPAQRSGAEFTIFKSSRFSQTFTTSKFSMNVRVFTFPRFAGQTVNTSIFFDELRLREVFSFYFSSFLVVARILS
jgi:hypothetical protein